MPAAVPPASDPPPGLRPVPGWIARGTVHSPADTPTDTPAGTPAEASADAAFRAGAALALLHPVVLGQVAGVPLALLADRMALAAAEAGITRAGGRARAAELRDRMGFLPAGARMDPESAQFALWRRAGTTDLRGDGLARLLPEGMAAAAEAADGSRCSGGPGGIACQVAGADGQEDGAGKAGAKEDGWEDGIGEDRSTSLGATRDGAAGDGVAAEGAAGSGASARGAAERGSGGDPVARAVRVLERFRDAPPDDRPYATMLADAALARALGWPRLLPLLSTGLVRGDFALEGCALRRACDRAIAREAVRAVRLAADLERRAVRLRAVAPRLRAKASDAAVALFLARDAVAPGLDLSPVIRGTRTDMSPRAAARLCDRLVSLGAVRELTGRATFRLYGL